MSSRGGAGPPPRRGARRRCHPRHRSPRAKPGGRRAARSPIGSGRKTQLSRLLERVRAGEEIILAKSGKPCAKLVPLEVEQPRVPGLARGKVTKAFFEPLPEKELKAWER